MAIIELENCFSTEQRVHKLETLVELNLVAANPGDLPQTSIDFYYQNLQDVVNTVYHYMDKIVGDSYEASIEGYLYQSVLDCITKAGIDIKERMIVKPL